MNRKQQSVVLAGMLAFALAGCSSMRGSSTDETGSAGSMGSGTSSMGSGSTSSTMGSGAAATSEAGAGGMAGTAGGSTASQQSQGTPSGAPATGTMTPNAVVMTIEAVPKPGAATGTGAVGGSGTGTTGSSMGEDKMYRVTLRMDDGTTLVVTQAAAPTFRMGDRVNLTEGTIRH